MNELKRCINCNNCKTFSEFYKSGKYLHSYCKYCFIKKRKDHRRTVRGVVYKIYSHQKLHSKDRGDILPNYTKEELFIWATNQDLFYVLYNNWIKGNYTKELVPSFDRLDDYKPYTLDNLQLMTWAENKKKGEKDKINGINNKQSRAVVGTHKETNKILKFHSMMEASRITGTYVSNISKNCSGKLKSANGYIWSYKTE